MRILWCTHFLAGFKAETGGYNGCGWITSLLQEFKKQPDCEIGIAFYYTNNSKPVNRDNVTFFPMKQGHVGAFDKLKSYIGDNSGWKKEEKTHLLGLKSVIEGFRPDIIHVWGTETDMGLIAAEVDIPVIIHLQGLLHPINNILCPPGFSKWDYIRKDGYNLIKIFKNLNGLHYWDYKAERETRIFKVCKNYFGRTHWDKEVSCLLSPNHNYYYCSEMLREEFYTDEVWVKPIGNKFRIISTISAPLYKGMDMILKTAKLLKEYSNIDFIWNIIGVDQATFIEKRVDIKASNVNVNLLGVKDANEIKTLELCSNVYMHPSYIDNSPNSICEAQLLGVPVVAVNVGGVSSVIEDRVTGFLIPSNEPHMAASLIMSVFKGTIDVGEISQNERKVAQKRHSKQDIINSLLVGYQQIIEKCK